MYNQQIHCTLHICHPDTVTHATADGIFTELQDVRSKG